jgi:hypothetical protein
LAKNKGLAGVLNYLLMGYLKAKLNFTLWIEATENDYGRGGTEDLGDNGNSAGSRGYT